jgi:MFS family permease
LLDFRLYGHYLAYTGIGCGVASLSLFAPTIVQGLGHHGVQAQLYTVPPYAVAFACTMLAAYLSDRYQSRGIIAGSALAVSTLCFTILGEQIK